MKSLSVAAQLDTATSTMDQITALGHNSVMCFVELAHTIHVSLQPSQATPCMTSRLLNNKRHLTPAAPVPHLPCAPHLQCHHQVIPLLHALLQVVLEGVNEHFGLL